MNGKNFWKFFSLVTLLWAQLISAQTDSDMREALRSLSWKKIKSGRFIMGASGEKNEYVRPIRVEISRHFEIMETEVTQEQWFLVMGENPSRFKTSRFCSNSYGDVMCPGHPVENVSWNDVQGFIQKLNDFQGLKCLGIPGDPSGCLRLPTEAEWEYAARGRKETAWSFGDDWKKLEKHAWYGRNSRNRTAPVGRKKRNPYKLRDMHGNVWEWVQDAWSVELPGEIDPLVEGDADSLRVIRGGSWNSAAGSLRSASRSYDDPDVKLATIGFRLVRNL